MGFILNKRRKNVKDKNVIIIYWYWGTRSRLKNINFDYELANFSELDKYAIKSYTSIHNVNQDLNLGDITKINIDKLPSNIDLITYGFPCQDISIVGKQKGFFDENNNKTRSGLFFNALNIIKKVRPKIAIAENVKNLTSKKFEKEFNIVLNSLKEIGYNNYWKILKASDFGIPQNRERVFIISIRQDIDDGTFSFPKTIPLKNKIKDFLEENVPIDFYSNIFIDNNYIKKQEDKFSVYKSKNSIALYNTCEIRSGVANYLTQGLTRKEVSVAVSRTDGISYTLRASNVMEIAVPSLNKNFKYQLRKLTPLECFRLMGFSDTDFIQAALQCNEEEARKIVFISKTQNKSISAIVLEKQKKIKKTLFQKLSYINKLVIVL